MTFHDDTDRDLEQRLRRISAEPQPDVPASLYRRATDMASGELRGEANEITLAPLQRIGRPQGVRHVGALAGLAAVLVVAVVAMGLLVGQRGSNPSAMQTSPGGSVSPVTTPSPEASEPAATYVPCTRLPMRPDAVAALVSGGAAIVYERNGGFSCVDALYAIYPDGRVVSDFGDGNPSASQLAAGRVATLLDTITTVPDAANGWFTDYWYSTYHAPCGACYTYSLTITYQGDTKTVGAVDGGTDAMAGYWTVTEYLAEVLPAPKEASCCGFPTSSGSSASGTASP